MQQLDGAGAPRRRGGAPGRDDADAVGTRGPVGLEVPTGSGIEAGAVGANPADGRADPSGGGSLAERQARAAALLAQAEELSGLRGGAETGFARTPDVHPAGVASTSHRADVASTSLSADVGGSTQAGEPGDEREPPGRRSRRGRRAIGETTRAGDAGSGPPPDDPASVAPDADPEAVARAIVLRQLSMAPRSRGHLEKKLRLKGCDDAVAERVLDRMTQVGLVDDEAFAEMLVRERQAGKGLARRALAHELRKQGVDQEIADEALGQIADGSERLRAEQLVAKKLRTMHGLAPDVQARRLAGMLARKGYPGEIAWPVIREAVDRAPEHRRD